MKHVEVKNKTLLENKNFADGKIFIVNCIKIMTFCIAAYFFKFGHPTHTIILWIMPNTFQPEKMY
jgi:hypothetical protein